MRRYPLLILVAAAGCAGGPRLMELSHWSPPRLQRCTVNEPQGTLTTLLDSAALARRIGELRLPDGALVMSVSVDSGEVERVRPVESSYPPGESFRLEQAIAEAVTAPAGERAWGRLMARVRDGALDTLALGAYQTCRPVLANRERLAEYLEEAYQRIRLTGSADIDMFVDGSGSVIRVEIQESSGVPDLDQHLMLVARSVEFLPALIDREPLGVWVRLTLTIQSDGPTDPWGGGRP